MHQGSLPLPRLGSRVRCCRRTTGSASASIPSQNKPSSPTQQSFDYPLLSDTSGAIAAEFGVKRGLLGKLIPVKRTTFVIDTDRTVLDVISSEFSMDTHADKALQTLKSRK